MNAGHSISQAELRDSDEANTLPRMVTPSECEWALDQKTALTSKAACFQAATHGQHDSELGTNTDTTILQ